MVTIGCYLDVQSDLTWDQSWEAAPVEAPCYSQHSDQDSLRLQGLWRTLLQRKCW